MVAQCIMDSDSAFFCPMKTRDLLLEKSFLIKTIKQHRYHYLSISFKRQPTRDRKEYGIHSTRADTTTYIYNNIKKVAKWVSNGPNAP